MMNSDSRTSKISQGPPLLHLAVSSGEEKLVLKEIDKETNLNESWDGEAPIHIASRLGFTEIVKVLLEKGADPSLSTLFRNESGVFLAASKDFVNIVQLLLKYSKGGGQQKELETQALLASARYGCIGVLNFLLKKGIDVNQILPSQQTALTLASRYGHKNIVKKLIYAKCDVNQIDEEGQYSLGVAVQFQHSSLVVELLKYGANPNICSEGQQGFPVHTAVSYENFSILQDLLGCGKADPNVVSEKGQTPLYMAAELGYQDIAKELLWSGADPDIYTYDHENTPLFAALDKPVLSLYLNANKSAEGLSKILIEGGCNVDHENSLGQTPMQVALDNQLCNVALIFLAADCNLHSESWFTCEMDFYIISLENGCPELYSTFIQELKNPKSLKRLCRITVRDWITGLNEWPFKKIISKLPLPRVLQDYLCYKNLP